MTWTPVNPYLSDGGEIAAPNASPKLYPDPLNPELDNPDSVAWEQGGRVHNWQNYIGDRTRPLWASFSNELKLALAWDADDAAGREEWD